MGWRFGKDGWGEGAFCIGRFGVMGGYREGKGRNRRGRRDGRCGLSERLQKRG